MQTTRCISYSLVSRDPSVFASESATRGVLNTLLAGKCLKGALIEEVTHIVRRGHATVGLQTVGAACNIDFVAKVTLFEPGDIVFAVTSQKIFVTRDQKALVTCVGMTGYPDVPAGFVVPLRVKHVQYPSNNTKIVLLAQPFLPTIVTARLTQWEVTAMQRAALQERIEALAEAGRAKEQLIAADAKGYAALDELQTAKKTGEAQKPVAAAELIAAALENKLTAGNYARAGSASSTLIGLVPAAEPESATQQLATPFEELMCITRAALQELRAVNEMTNVYSRDALPKYKSVLAYIVKMK